ncbi:hypothetical protein SDC9_107952 [bioreactor metagenome]|uniref:Uncharacterized protein n=1 Tax=bioreactor metagenome TaxID=1076179 RepID=A0A645B7S9_9ZZZZ
MRRMTPNRNRPELSVPACLQLPENEYFSGSFSFSSAELPELRLETTLLRPLRAAAGNISKRSGENAETVHHGNV